MKYSLHTVYTSNLHPDIITNFKEMCRELKIDVTLHEKTSVIHSEWMTAVMRSECNGFDVVGFLDIDLYISDKKELLKLLYYAYKFNTITGLAYSNNSNGKNYISVSAFCYIISSKLYKQLRNPNFGTVHELVKDNNTVSVYDTGENVVRMAEKIGRKIFTYFPTSYEKNNIKFIEKLGPSVFRINYYGVFGAGSIYQGKFFHLGESRLVRTEFKEYKPYFYEPMELLNSHFEYLIKNKKLLKGKHCSINWRIPYRIVDEFSTINEDVNTINYIKFFPRKQLQEILDLPFSKNYVFV